MTTLAKISLYLKPKVTGVVSFMLLRRIGYAIRNFGDKLVNLSGSSPYSPITTSPPTSPSPTVTPTPTKPTYNPKAHKTYYLVGASLLDCLLKDPTPKTVSGFTDRCGFPPSTIRGVCKELVKDGLLEQVTEYPAVFRIREGAHEKAVQFVDQHMMAVAQEEKDADE